MQAFGVILDVSRRKEAELELAKAKSEAEAVIQHFLDSLVAVNIDLCIIRANHATSHLLGYTEEELLGQPVTLLFNDPSPRIREIFTFYKSQDGDPPETKEELRNVELSYRPKGGGDLPMSFNISVLRDGEGEILGVVAGAKDVSKLRFALDRISCQNRYIDKLISILPNGFVALSPSLEIKKTNRAFQNILIKLAPRLRMTGAECARFLMEQVTTQATSFGEFFTVKFLIQERAVFLRCSYTPVSGWDDTTAVITLADVTKEKRLNEERKLLAKAIEQSWDAVVITNTSHRILYVNPIVLEKSGYSAEEYIGKTPWYFRDGLVDPAELEKMSQVVGNGEVWSGTVKMRNKDGSITEEEITVSPVRNDDGRLSHYVAVKRDITELKGLERQLALAQKMEALGTLAGGIAHDFNNILAALLGYTDLARLRLKDQPVVQECLDQVSIAGRRATELVQQILTFSRRQDAKLQPLRIPIVVKEVLKLLRASLPATIDIKTAINTDVEMVLADPTQIHQVIMNLCINASHAMEETGGTLTVNIEQVRPEPAFISAHPGLLPGPYLCVQISDTGHGMRPEILPLIFDPYFTTKEQGKGTGLGLAMVHSIIKQYQGDIVVDSVLGKGTTFAIYLPVVPNQETSRSRHADRKLMGQGEHVLIVDDEPILCKFYQQFLQSQGYRITTCTDPMRALSLFESAPTDYDLVLSDVTMHGMTGDQMGLHMMEARPELPVLLMTGYTKILSKEQAEALGFRAFLAKPVPQRDLLETLRAVLDSSNEKHDNQERLS